MGEDAETDTSVYTKWPQTQSTPDIYARKRTLRVDEALVVLEEDAEDRARGDGGVDVGGAVQRVEHGHVPGWLDAGVDGG